MNRFNNLTLATMPGSNYLMPGGIGALGVPMAGTDWTSNFASSLYTPQLGAGDGGGIPNQHPESTLQTDSEDYVCTHLPISTKHDGSHADLLFKHALVFGFRETPMNGGGPVTVVPLNWLNIFSTKQFHAGREKFDTFMIDFMKRHQSAFPDVYQDLRSDFNGNIGNGSIDPYHIAMGSSSPPDWLDSGDLLDDAEDDAFDTYFGSGGSSKGGPQTRGRHVSALSGRRDEDGELREAFVKFLALNMPPEDSLFSDTSDVRWISSKFTVPQFGLEHAYTKLLEELDQKSRQGQGVASVSGQVDDVLNDPYMSKLVAKFKTQQDLKKNEGKSGSGNALGRGGNDYHHHDFNNSSGNALDILGQGNVKKLVEHAKERHLKEKTMIEEVVSFFRSAAQEPKNAQLGEYPNGVDYMHRGGIQGNWTWLGVANTITDDTSRKHAYGISFASYPLAKIVFAREDLTFNIWGKDLPIYTKLYLVIRRRPLVRFSTSYGGSGMLNLDGMDVDSMLRSYAEESGDSFHSISKMIRAAWNDYDAYEVMPYQNGRRGIDRASLGYINVFGRLEYPVVIQVGVTKHDYNFHNYNYRTRNMAIGIPDPDTGVPPTLEASKRAMMSLDTITVLFRIT